MQFYRPVSRFLRGLFPESPEAARLRQLAQRIDEQSALIRRQSERLEQVWRMQIFNARSLRWIAEQAAEAPPAAPSAELLVSVVIPTWNRERTLRRAIESVLAQTYPHWECFVVDDGSTDGTRAAVAPYLKDPRVRYLYQEHRNASAARNAAMARAQGEIFAYLDSDNRWYPGYLAALVQAYSADDALQCAYTAQLVEEADPPFCHVRCQPFDFAQLVEGNYIDVNVFSHRRGLFERYGGFDEAVERLDDWDLLLRYTEHEKTRCLPVFGSIYADGHPDQVSRNHAYSYGAYLLKVKRRRPAQSPLKVLYALWHYPQLSESYVRTEILAARTLGVEVEVWSETGPAAAFASEVPVHRGSLRDALARFKPDLVHVHWLNMADKLRPEIEAAGLPLTVRAHSFDFSPDLARRLAGEASVEAVYVFPHQAARCAPLAPKIRPLPAVFNPELYFPAQRKDPKLVVRAGAALPTKDYATFLRVARLCPGHRFVLALCHASLMEPYLAEVVALRDQLESPVEIRVDVQHEDLARLLGDAGTYLHTTAPEQAFGMPASIAEAMATGCRILGRLCAGAPEYVGDAGRLYDSDEEAAERIRETAAWGEEDWKKARLRSVERAYALFASTTVLEPLVADWRRIAARV